MKEFQLRDAKANLSAVIDEVLEGETCLITRHGKPQAVIVGYEEWRRLSNVPSFGRLLMAAPEGLKGSSKRDRSGLRSVDL